MLRIIYGGCFDEKFRNFAGSNCQEVPILSFCLEQTCHFANILHPVGLKADLQYRL